MLISKNITIICTYNNKDWITKAGYNWRSRDSIDINIEDIYDGCSSKIEAICDYCGKNKIYRPYNQYINSRKYVPKDACSKCASIKQQEVMKAKYGVTNPRHIKSISEKISNTRKVSISEIIDILTNYNCEFIEELYSGDNKKIPYRCLRHNENLKKEEVQYVSLGNLRSSKFCKYCGYEKISKRQIGEKSIFWKDGRTDISSFLRQRLTIWKSASFNKYNNKCVITGETTNLEIHHLVPFNSILDETLVETKFTLKKNISDYSQEELEKLVTTFLTIHNKYPLGIPLKKEIHSTFHNIYGYDCNKEDFIDFLYDKYRIKLNEKYEYIPVEYSNFFDYKINSSSKYKGVCYVDSARNLKWKATLHSRNGTKIEVGYFLYEYEAAEAYNKKALELYGETAILNKLDENDKPNNYEFYKQYHNYKARGTSKFYGVHKYNNVYVSRLTYNQERISIGYYNTELEAAYFYNKKVKEINEKYNEQLKLNFLTKEEISMVENEILKYFNHKKNSDTIYKCVFLRKKDIGSKCWESFFHYRGKFHYLGRFYTDIEAAKAYNEYVIKNNMNRKLNKIIENFNENEELEKVHFQKKFYKLKINTSSKFTGISYIKTINCFRARVNFNKKNIMIGDYDNEILAAYKYNEKVEEINKKYNCNLKLNYLTEKEVDYAKYLIKQKDDDKYFVHKDDGNQSIYTCVYKKKGVKTNPWYFRIILSKEDKIYRYGFKSDIEAAKAYNEYIIRNNLNKKLNRINYKVPNII